MTDHRYINEQFQIYIVPGRNYIALSNDLKEWEELEKPTMPCELMKNIAITDKFLALLPDDRYPTKILYCNIRKKD